MAKMANFLQTEYLVYLKICFREYKIGLVPDMSKKGEREKGETFPTTNPTWQPSNQQHRARNRFSEPFFGVQ